MISFVEARLYRCLRYIAQPLNSFHVLVGPNASGKTTFLDVVAFLGRLVSDGLDAAIAERTDNFHDLLWGRGEGQFELAIEARIPEERRLIIAKTNFDTIRYEVAVGADPATGQASILAEKALLKIHAPQTTKEPELFPFAELTPNTILSTKSARTARTVVNKVSGGNDNFYSEVYEQAGKGWAVAFKLGLQKSALGNLPEDETKFPVSTWLKSMLTEGIQQLVLNSLLMRKPSPPGQSLRFKADGSNLPWVVEHLRATNQPRFKEWLAHLKTALPDLKDVRTIERPEDRHRYLLIKYSNDLEVPSWMTSDGTLRLMALTLLAYVDDLRGVYLIEEPENGVHPRAVETMFQSLSSVYEAQILLATHSPIVLSVVDPKDVLCFAKTPDGATDIVAGSAHPRLRHWRGEENLGVLFAAGVLG